MAVNNINSKYSQEYLNEINDVLTNRADANGNKDGKVTTDEAFNDLDIDSLFYGLDENSGEYSKLKSLTDGIPDILEQYAGSDGIFQAEEWADFINSDEWGAVIDQYHSSSNFAELEMKWIDNSTEANSDGIVTKDEIKTGLKDDIKKSIPSKVKRIAINWKLDKLIDKYAEKDGSFTVESYTALINDAEYKKLIDKYQLVPFSH